MMCQSAAATVSVDNILHEFRQIIRHFKPGFHYKSWRPELTARVDGW